MGRKVPVERTEGVDVELGNEAGFLITHQYRDLSAQKSENDYVPAV